MARGARWLSLALLAVALAAGCRAAGQRVAPTPTGSGQPRTFAMGISSLPPELTEDSYAATFALAGSAGDVILIQRTPPWDELLAGGISPQTAQTTTRETQLAKDNGLSLFVAIDPTDPALGRSALANLPPALRGAGFADRRIHDAFVSYAGYVAENYRPKYLALGVDVNSYQSQHPEDFSSFVATYKDAYASVKQLSPGTLVFPVFQYEELQGLVPVDNPRLPQWNLITLFEPQLDLLAVSSFPNTVFSSADQLPFAYYSQLAAYTSHPVAIAELGYPSGSGDAGNTPQGEQDQAAFLSQALDGAQRLAMPLVVWFAGQDLTYTGQPPFDRLQHLGLKRQDGSPKPSWAIWQVAARRPLAGR